MKRDYFYPQDGNPDARFLTAFHALSRMHALEKAYGD